MSINTYCIDGTYIIVLMNTAAAIIIILYILVYNTSSVVFLKCVLTVYGRELE